MDIPLADVTLHIDENLDAAARQGVEDQLRALRCQCHQSGQYATPHHDRVQPPGNEFNAVA